VHEGRIGEFRDPNFADLPRYHSPDFPGDLVAAQHETPRDGHRLTRPRGRRLDMPRNGWGIPQVQDHFHGDERHRAGWILARDDEGFRDSPTRTRPLHAFHPSDPSRVDHQAAHRPVRLDRDDHDRSESRSGGRLRQPNRDGVADARRERDCLRLITLPTGRSPSGRRPRNAQARGSAPPS